jgi:hypothetical protein
MPIEVRELVIRATIVDEYQDDQTGSRRPETRDNQLSEREDIIKICVERVLQILKNRNAR